MQNTTRRVFDDNANRPAGHAIIRFGTGGWRAEIGKDFHMDNVRLIGQAMANRILFNGDEKSPVVIGYDRRFLSDSAAKWLAEVLAGNGITVWFMRRSAPISLVMHTVMKKKLCYGLEVTASHNPPTYNGIKIIVSEGRDAPADFTRQLEGAMCFLEYMDVKSMPFAEAVAAGKIVYLETPFNDFLDDILAVLDNEAIRRRGPRILFDTMHGSATYPLTTIFYTDRCTVDLLHSEKDAYFGGMLAEPSEGALQELQRQVVAGGYDLGIGIDGDGDRLGIIDRDGSYLDGNDILVLMYDYLHQRKGWKGAVVRNMTTTHMLNRMAKDFGEECYEVPVGFKYVSAKIDDTDALLGGEGSGGLAVRGHIHGKDSVYAAALFVEMICATGQSAGELLKELRAKYGTFCQEEVNLAFDPAEKERIWKTVMRKRVLPDFGCPVERAGYLDGCKVYFPDDSFVVCRFSGTEPLLRITAEGATKKQCLAYIDAWRNMLEI